ncbi:MAG TPA: histidine ammonia-lyase, partial [Micrococcaceae bacterium]|nr:histidine ammonia-lyase [Micrococcaceae bacterium]
MNTSPASVTLHLTNTTAQDVLHVARHGIRVDISAEVNEKLAEVRTHIDALAASETPVYGISTGFGALATRHIAA